MGARFAAWMAKDIGCGIGASTPPCRANDSGVSARVRQGVVAVVQARMTSSRLPGKVLADIGGQPALALLLSRLERARELDTVVVATSWDTSDDPVATAAEAAGVRVVRGPLDDVLERYRLAASGDAVVRITGDCPLVDPQLVDRAVEIWKQGSYDYVANCLEPRSFPDGLDVEVIARDALEAVAGEAVDPSDREHVTPFLRERPERFRQAALELEPPFPDMRITLDTAEDLQRIRQLVLDLGPTVGMTEIVSRLEQRPVQLSVCVRTGEARTKLT